MPDACRPSRTGAIAVDDLVEPEVEPSVVGVGGLLVEHRRPRRAVLLLAPGAAGERVALRRCFARVGDRLVEVGEAEELPSGAGERDVVWVHERRHGEPRASSGRRRGSRTAPRPGRRTARHARGRCLPLAMPCGSRPIHPEKPNGASRSACGTRPRVQVGWCRCRRSSSQSDVAARDRDVRVRDVPLAAVLRAVAAARNQSPMVGTVSGSSHIIAGSTRAWRVRRSGARRATSGTGR